MRKTTICLLLLLCSLAALGQTQPQWKVVQHVILTRQTAPIQQTTIFTATKPGLYRLSAYISAEGAEGQGVSWNLRFFWTDTAGESANTLITALVGPGPSFAEIGGYVLAPQVGMPVTYLVDPNGNPAGDYNIAFTIEQLR